MDQRQSKPGQQQGKSGTSKSIVAVLGIACVYILAQVTGLDLFGGATDTTLASESSNDTGALQSALRDDTAKIQLLFSGRRSDIQVEAVGEVVKVLPVDTQGDRHQLFLCELSNGMTLKISHNIDIAPPIPLDEGDVVRFHGEYAWNNKGGVVHWTHRNLRGGEHEGGWIELDGKRYQ